MSKTISSLNVVLGATVAPFVNAFKGAEGAASSLTSSLAHVGSAMASLTGVGLAIGAIGSVVEKAFAMPGEAFAAAQRQADAETRLVAVLRATGGAAGFSAEQLKAHAAALQKTTTYGDEAIIEFQSTLATFRNVSGGTFTKATSLALDMASVMGGDLQSTAVQLGKALNDPVEGMTALRRVGVSFTDQQEQQIKAMETAGNLAGAQTVILGELQNEFGGVAEAMAKTPFGHIKQIGNAVGDLAEQVGSMLATVGDGFAKAFNIDGAIAGLSSGLAVAQTVVTNAAGYFGAAHDLIASAFSSLYDVVAPAVGGIVNWVGQNWQAMVDAATPILSAYVGLVEAEFFAIWDGITAVGNGIAAAWSWAMDEIGVVTGRGVGAAGNALQTLGAWAKYLGDGITLALNSAAFAFTNFGQLLTYTVTAAAAEWVTFYNQIGYGITDVIGGYLKWLGQNWQNIFIDMLNVSSAVFTNLATNAGNFFAGLWSWMKGDGFNFKWTGLTEGFQSTLTDLPTIAARQMGPIEQSLHQQADAMGQNLAVGYSDFLKAQDNQAKATAQGVKHVIGEAGQLMSKLAIPELPKPATLDAKGMTKPLKDVTASADRAKKSIQGLDAVMRGSAESLKLQFEGKGLAAAKDAMPIPAPETVAAKSWKSDAEAAMFGSAAPTAVAFKGIDTSAQPAWIQGVLGNVQDTAGNRDFMDVLNGLQGPNAEQYLNGTMGAQGVSLQPPEAAPVTAGQIQSAGGGGAGDGSDSAKLTAMIGALYALHQQWFALDRGRPPAGATAVVAM